MGWVPVLRSLHINGHLCDFSFHNPVNNILNSVSGFPNVDRMWPETVITQFLTKAWERVVNFGHSRALFLMANDIKGTTRSFITGLHKAERQVSSWFLSKCLWAESTPVSAAVFSRRQLVLSVPFANSSYNYIKWLICRSRRRRTTCAEQCYTTSWRVYTFLSLQQTTYNDTHIFLFSLCILEISLLWFLLQDYLMAAHSLIHCSH